MSYAEKLDEEIRTYENVANVHELPPIFHYWSDKFLRPKFEELGFKNPNDFFVGYLARTARAMPHDICRVLSLGAGNCDTEILLTELLIERGVRNLRFDCLDLNGQMLQRGATASEERGLGDHFDFIETDINSWNANVTYHAVLANQSLHHFVELEELLDKTYRSLAETGVFLTNDMIGRNGHMRWPEALEIVQACWSLLDRKHKFNHQLKRYEETYENWDCSVSGFEGIRAQDILPLLLKQFHFDCFLGFANVINVFVDRGFGPNFDISDSRDCHFIEFVGGLDDYFIEAGKIKPTQMLAALTKGQRGETKVYKHLTPQFCVREPSA